MPFDFDAAVRAPFRMQPGLRRLSPGTTQFTPLAPGDAARRRKLEVLTGHSDEALCCMAGFDPQPALRALAVEVSARHPGTIEVDATGLAAPDAGWHVAGDGTLSRSSAGADAELGACLAALPPAQRPAALLSLLLHEDLAIVDGDSATLPWMAVCLPSHWSPRDKCGRSFAEVHGPVADNAVLLAAGRHLMHLVCQPARWERFVWTITSDGQLDQHPMRHVRRPWAGTPEAVAAQAWWRTEHQTFVPLPGLRQAIFTIHVESQPLVQAVASPPRARALHEALATMSDAVLAYRQLAEARDPLLAWLARRGTA